jgi:hypothetical protein
VPAGLVWLDVQGCRDGGWTRGDGDGLEAGWRDRGELGAVVGHWVVGWRGAYGCARGAIGREDEGLISVMRKKVFIIVWIFGTGRAIVGC